LLNSFVTTNVDVEGDFSEAGTIRSISSNYFSRGHLG
jgi:hypothetical protein